MLFRKKPPLSERPSCAAMTDPGASRVPRSATLAGSVAGVLHLAIEGAVAGDVAAEGEVWVAPGARVHGGIRARVVLVAGTVLGPVYGEERVELLAGGRVDGDLRSAHVIVADGADLHGKVDVLKSS